MTDGLGDASSERLLRLIEAYRAEVLSTTEFCDQFERLFNSELDLASLNSSQVSAFARLFDVVVWYSPFREERERIPHYVGEADVRAAVEATRRELG